MICETLAGGEVNVLTGCWMPQSRSVKPANLRIQASEEPESGTTTLLNVWALKWPAVA